MSIVDDAAHARRHPSAPPAAPGPEAAAPATYREFYEYEADVYRITEEDEPAFRFRRLLVQKLLPRDAARAVLDAGCGDGSLALDLHARTGAALTGMDLSWKRAIVARQRMASLRALQGSIYDIPFADGSFPLVTCTDLLEHLDDPVRAVAELVRVSSRHLILTVPYNIRIEKTLCPHCHRDYFLYGHQHSFGKEGIERLAAQAGARVRRFEHVIPMFECRRYKLLPPLKWLLWDHFKNSGTLGALLEKVNR